MIIKATVDYGVRTDIVVDPVSIVVRQSSGSVMITGDELRDIVAVAKLGGHDA